MHALTTTCATHEALTHLFVVCQSTPSFQYTHLSVVVNLLELEQLIFTDASLLHSTAQKPCVSQQYHHFQSIYEQALYVFLTKSYANLNHIMPPNLGLRPPSIPNPCPPLQPPVLPVKAG